MIVAKRNEEKEMFRKNLRLLTPWLRDSVLRIDENELWEKVKVSYNGEGYPVCRYHQEDKCFHITGGQPLLEAELWYKGIYEQGTGAIFLYGSGFGYSLFEVFARKRPHTLVILFEQDIFLFTAMLYYFDLEPIIETRKICFLIGDTDYFAKNFKQMFFSLALISCTYPTIAFTHAARRNFYTQYIKIHKYVFTELKLLIFYTGNSHLDYAIGFHNILANTKEIIQNPYISCLKNKYKDVPAFIIANGPSLDKNILQLKKIGDKGLILSTESAILPLMKNNIKPDILTAIERTKNTYTCHFENMNYSDDITLLCLALVDKRVFPSFPGPKIPIFRKGEAVNQFVNRNIGDGSAINAGANVSHLAFELAVHMGANPIVFVGQDYAYGPEGDTHSKDSVYYEERGKKSREAVESRDVINVEGNDGTIIASNQLWVDFKLGLEHKIAAYPGKNIINATEGGARIKGTKCGKLSDIIEEFCTTPITCRVNEIITENKAKISIEERIMGLQKFKESSDYYKNLFRDLCRTAVAGKRKCRDMIRLSQNEDASECRGILEEAYQNNINTYPIFIKDDLCGGVTQQPIFIYYFLMDHLGRINTPEKTTEIFRIQYSFFQYLNIVCQSTAVFFENASEFLEELLKELQQT